MDGSPAHAEEGSVRGRVGRHEVTCVDMACAGVNEGLEEEQQSALRQEKIITVEKKPCLQESLP
jgi:hypothetical protein